MASTPIAQSHIAYELIDETHPQVTVIEFLSREIISSAHAAELGEQLGALIRPDMPRQFILDFQNVRNLGSTAYERVVSFVRAVRSNGGNVKICAMRPIVRFGADVVGLGDFSDFVESRQAAIDEALAEEDQPRFIDDDIG
jgi:anti-anti-sigma factor